VTRAPPDMGPKWEGQSTLRWVEFRVTSEFLDHLSAIVQDARARLGAA